MHDIMYRNLALPISLHIHRVFQNLIKIVPQILPSTSQRSSREPTSRIRPTHVLLPITQVRNVTKRPQSLPQRFLLQPYFHFENLFLDRAKHRLPLERSCPGNVFIPRRCIGRVFPVDCAEITLPACLGRIIARLVVVLDIPYEAQFPRRAERARDRREGFGGCKPAREDGSGDHRYPKGRGKKKTLGKVCIPMESLITVGKK